MATEIVKAIKGKFGTAPVFLTAISTILGAIMFLRFGYAVGHVGFWGLFAIIIIGHLVTIPTAMSIAEIATNQKVEGGGEYYIISRSFGLSIGAAIGIALFLSQAISVAFYIIAFAEAFDPVINWLKDTHGIWIYDKRAITIPALFILLGLMLTKGADMGVVVLYFVVATLFIALLMFFAGSTGYAQENNFSSLSDTVTNPDNFFYVFAICFPAFTGMTAGVGLSGDLKDPKKSIPLGTLSATLIGMVVYVFIAYKLAISAAPEELATDQLIMGKIAIWAAIIPIGLAAATISSALGSVMVAPRTLQALSGDRVFPSATMNRWLSKGTKSKNEPIHATFITGIIALGIIMIGDVNFVAEIISMFFMVTYGSICLISFLEHFAADPSYRPAFKSKWYISLLGAVMCIWLMFKMNAPYAILSILLMVTLYLFISRNRGDKDGVARIFKGVIFQLSRQLQVFVQKKEKEDAEDNWRPSVICVTDNSFERFSAFNMLKWISHKYGFGTYIHLINGYLSKDSRAVAQITLKKLVKITNITKSNVYIDTLISPSYTSAIAQALQLPSVSGKENNMILFEFSKNDYVGVDDIVDNFAMIKALEFDVCILGSSDKNFGFKNEIHIWIKPEDFENANLIILMGYIIIGHPEWKNANLKIFAIYPADEMAERRETLNELIKTGRIPISPKNISLIPMTAEVNPKDIINNVSAEADLTMVGFRAETLKHSGISVFQQYDKLGDVLFVNTMQHKVIK